MFNEEVVEEVIEEEVVEEPEEVVVEEKTTPVVEEVKANEDEPEEENVDEVILDDGETNASLLARAKAGFKKQEHKEKRELSFGDVEENPYYGNPKVKKLYSSPLKRIAIISILVILVALGVGIALKFAAVI